MAPLSALPVSMGRRAKKRAMWHLRDPDVSVRHQRLTPLVAHVFRDLAQHMFLLLLRSRKVQRQHLLVDVQVVRLGNAKHDGIHGLPVLLQVPDARPKRSRQTRGAQVRVVGSSLQREEERAGESGQRKGGRHRVFGGMARRLWTGGGKNRRPHLLMVLAVTCAPTSLGKPLACV